MSPLLSALIQIDTGAASAIGTARPGRGMKNRLLRRMQWWGNSNSLMRALAPCALVRRRGDAPSPPLRWSVIIAVIVIGAVSAVVGIVHVRGAPACLHTVTLCNPKRAGTISGAAFEPEVQPERSRGV